MGALKGPPILFKITLVQKMLQFFHTTKHFCKFFVVKILTKFLKKVGALKGTPTLLKWFSGSYVQLHYRMSKTMNPQNCKSYIPHIFFTDTLSDSLKYLIHQDPTNLYTFENYLNLYTRGSSRYEGNSCYRYLKSFLFRYMKSKSQVATEFPPINYSV